MTGQANEYRKTPVVVEAVQYWPGKTCQAVAALMGIDHIEDDCYDDAEWLIDTLEGTMSAKPGDWIIRDVQGEFYPCKPDIFEATYVPARPVVSPPDSTEAERVAEIQARVDAATEGPWWAPDHTIYAAKLAPPNALADAEEWDAWLDQVTTLTHGETETKDDADFVAHAREDIPYLLGRLAASPPSPQLAETQDEDTLGLAARMLRTGDAEWEEVERVCAALFTAASLVAGLREFVVAHTLLEKGVIDFDLHADAVERFRRASEHPDVRAIISAALASVAVGQPENAEEGSLALSSEHDSVKGEPDVA